MLSAKADVIDSPENCKHSPHLTRIHGPLEMIISFLSLRI